MKKVIEILKEHKYSLECLVENDIVSHLLKQTNEAIKELEELQQEFDLKEISESKSRRVK